MDKLSSAHALRSLFAGRTLVGFLFFVLVYLLSCSLLFYRDPTSLFFRPALAYRHLYSAHRQEEAARYISVANTALQWKRDPSQIPTLCVGIASIARNGSRYFRDSVGSVLDGLHKSERARIHLILFFAHSDPSVHPAFMEPWTQNVADTILTYNLTADEMMHIKEMEAKQGVFRDKAKFDFSYLLQACQKTEAESVLVLEDDTLAVDGWYHRTIDAVAVASQKTHALTASSYLYLRLFYTEEYFGWNSEEWSTYLVRSLELLVVELLLLLGLRRAFAKYRSVRLYFTNDMVLFYLFALTPIAILLFFAIGRNSISPLPHGVVEMPKFGCCSQALLFPQSRIPDVVKFFNNSRDDFRDTLLEEYANARGEIRWATVPSLFQHVGTKSSKEHGHIDVEQMKHGRPITEVLFNFEFEMFDPLVLRQQHLQVLEKQKIAGIS